MKIVKNDLFDYKNRYIYQHEKGFKFSVDSLLLAEYVNILKKDKLLVDFCTGNCVVPLVISTKSSINIMAFEISEEVYSLALKSVNLNNVDNIEVINSDIKRVFDYLGYNSVDIITCNPPYFKIGENINNSKFKTDARHEVLITLEDIFSISTKLLSNNGTLYMVHRKERIDEIIILANKFKMNVKEVVFVSTRKDKIGLILVKCVKNSKFGVNITLKSIENLETYQNMFKEDK